MNFQHEACSVLILLCRGYCDESTSASRPLCRSAADITFATACQRTGFVFRPRQLVPVLALATARPSLAPQDAVVALAMSKFLSRSPSVCLAPQYTCHNDKPTARLCNRWRLVGMQPGTESVLTLLSGKTWRSLRSHIDKSCANSSHCEATVEGFVQTSWCIHFSHD